MRGWKAVSQGVAIAGALACAQAAEAGTLKTGMVQLTYSGDMLECAVTNLSGHSLVVGPVRVKNAANTTVASLPSTSSTTGRPPSSPSGRGCCCGPTMTRTPRRAARARADHQGLGGWRYRTSARTRRVIDINQAREAGSVTPNDAAGFRPNQGPR
jgi:hypothetical protein